MKHRRKRRRGFTLLEVLLVLAILGVIAAMVVPQLLGSQKKAMIDATRSGIVGLEQAWKNLQLGALNMTGAGAPGKIQEKQLTEQQKTTKAVQTLPDRIEHVLSPLILSPAPLG